MLTTLWPLILATLGVAGLGAGGVWAARLAWVRAFYARVQVERRVAALEVQQTYVDAKKAASADGVLTAEDALHARDLAVDRLLELVGIAALDRYLRIAGLPRAPAFVRAWAVSKVESMVAELALEEARGAGPRSAPEAGAVAAVVVATPGGTP